LIPRLRRGLGLLRFDPCLCLRVAHW
jgi:hypothetical protein